MWRTEIPRKKYLRDLGNYQKKQVFRWQATVGAINNATTQEPSTNKGNHTTVHGMESRALQTQKVYNPPQLPAPYPNREYPTNDYLERDQGGQQGQQQNGRKAYNDNYDYRGYNHNGGRPPNNGYPQNHGNWNRAHHRNNYQWKGNQSGYAPYYKGTQYNGQNSQTNQYYQHPQSYQYRTPQRGGPQHQYRGPQQGDYQHQGAPPPPYRGSAQGDGHYYTPKHQRVRYDRLR